MVEPEGMLPIFRDVLRSAGLPAREDTDVEVEVVTRADDTTDYTFYLNHGRAPVSFELPGPGTDLLTGIRHSDHLELGRYGVAVLAAPRSETIPFATLTPAKEDA
jgi:beta-galactosidase